MSNALIHCDAPWCRECREGSPEDRDAYESAQLTDELSRSILRGLDRCEDCASDEVVLACPFCGSESIDPDRMLCPRCQEGISPLRLCADCGEERP